MFTISVTDMSKADPELVTEALPKFNFADAKADVCMRIEETVRNLHQASPRVYGIKVTTETPDHERDYVASVAWSCVNEEHPSHVLIFMAIEED